MELSYQLPAAIIYPAYYCSGGPCETGIMSGSGLPAYLFNISYAENNGTFRRAPRPDLLLTNLSTYFTLRGSDFFGNLLFNQSKMVTSSPFLWTVQIPYGIFQEYNARDFWTTVQVKPNGGTPMVLDTAPRNLWVLPLKSGVIYWANFTLLDGNFGVVGTASIRFTMGTKASYTVNGTTITQVLQNGNAAWSTTNSTYGLTGGIGNVLLAPRGLDFFKPLYFGMPSWRIAGGFQIGLNLWTVILAAESIGLVGFMWSTRDLKWFKDFKRAVQRKPMAATVLIVLGFVLFLSAVLAITTGFFVIPFPVSIP